MKARKLTDILNDVVRRRPGIVLALDKVAARSRLRDALVSLREKRELSQRALASRIGCQQPAVARMESNNPVAEDIMIQSIVQYAQACDVHVGLVFFSATDDGLQIDSLVPLSEQKEVASAFIEYGENRENQDSRAPEIKSRATA